MSSSTLIVGISISLIFAPNPFSTYDISVQSISTNSSSFTFLGGSPSFLKIIDCIDGYVYYKLDVYQAPYTENSNLYLIHTETMFTPGYQAVQNHDTGNYVDRARIGKGFVHLTLERYKESSKGAAGNCLESKLLWPNSSSYKTTVSSSYGVNMNFSFDRTRGVELDDGGNLSAKTGDNEGTEIDFSFNRTSSTVTDNPQISTQFCSSNYNQGQWYYELVHSGKDDTPNIVGKSTYSLQSYMLFEMENNASINCPKESFIVTYDVMYSCLYFKYYNWRYGTEWSSSLRVTCFA